MAQKDIFSEFSVDEILSDVKARNGEPMKVWSLADVDKLLSESETPVANACAPQSETYTLRTAAKENAVEPKSVQQNDSADVPVSPLLEGAQETEPQKEPQPEPPISRDPLPGQISIEKTRAFNEVESHAVHDAGIAHRIGQGAVHTTQSPFAPPKRRTGMETDKNRERFMHRPEQKIEKTMEHKELLKHLPPKTIERPGVIVRKAADSTDADGLQAIPTLVLPEDALQAQREAETRIQEGQLHAPAVVLPQTQELDNQMRLAGFDTEEPIARIDEEEAELDLLERRREKAKKFRLFPGLAAESQPQEAEPDSDLQPHEAALLETADAEKTRVDFEQMPELHSPETDTQPQKNRGKTDAPASAEEPISVLREFYGPKDARGVREILQGEKRSYTVRAVLFAVLTAAALTAAISLRWVGFLLFNQSEAVYSTVHILFLVLAGLFAADDLKTAIVRLTKKRTDARTALLTTWIFGVLQVAVSFGFSEKLTVVPLYTALAMLVFLLYYIGRVIKRDNDIANFQMVSENTDAFATVSRIADENTAFEIGRGLLLGEPDIRYARKIKFPSAFVESAVRAEREPEVYTSILPVVLAAAVFVGAVTCFTTGDWFIGVSAMCVAAMAGVPMSGTLASAVALRATNRRLLPEAGMISGVQDAQAVIGANAVVLDAAELFDAEKCRLRGMKLYHKMRVDEALLYTAAMTIQAGGTLSSVFDGVILHKREMLPQVESLAYEERLGCSGWIYNQRVLVGNRDLLTKHNIDAPTRAEEQKFLRDGCSVLYLAVEGKIAALFVVEYAANLRLRGYLQALEKYGINILLRTADPNITEGLVEQYFALPHNLVKVINPVAGTMFCTLRDEDPKPAKCTILHNRSTQAFLHALLSAFVLEEKFKLRRVLLYIGAGLSITMVALLSFFTGLQQMSVGKVLVFELLWMAIAVGIPNLKRI